MAYNPYDTPRGRMGALALSTRRQFLLLMGAIGGLGALVFGGIESLKFLFPGVTSDPPAAFKLEQDPSTITVGDVVQISDKRVSVVHDQDGFYAVLLICTHLGCTPNFVTDVIGATGVNPAAPSTAEHYKAIGPSGAGKGWACPCHGSRYFIDSTNFYGPAPRPMDWVDIAYTPDGRLIVDRSKLVAQRGAGQTVVPQWRLDPQTKKSNGKTLGV